MSTAAWIRVVARLLWPSRSATSPRPAPRASSPVASECRSRFPPRLAASIPARASALSTARHTMLPLIGAPTRWLNSTNTSRAGVSGRPCCK
jgi:hypothetical protein